MHLVGFIIRIYPDAGSHECQIREKQRFWFPYAIVCGFCPGSVWNTEGSELEAGVVQFGRWLSSRIMGVRVTELEVWCIQYSHAVDSSTFAQFLTLFYVSH